MAIINPAEAQDAAIALMAPRRDDTFVIIQLSPTGLTSWGNT
jgi:hypothetical protein